MLFAWICIVEASSVYWLYVSRTLAGISGGITWTTLSVFIAEIADPEIRGCLVNFKTE